MLMMNGDKPFFHPFSSVFVGAYQWYEGPAHQEHENVVEDENDDAAGKPTRGKRIQK